MLQRARLCRNMTTRETRTPRLRQTKSQPHGSYTQFCDIGDIAFSCCYYRFSCFLKPFSMEKRSYSKNAIGVKKASKKKGHFPHIDNEIKICSQNKCHHHLSNVCENLFRMFHSNWVISDYHSFVWQFVTFSQGNSNCPNK